MIYTSYFGNSKKWKNMSVISIARHMPKGLDIPMYPPLYPPADLLWAYKEGRISQEEYVNWYTKAVLNHLNVKEEAEGLDEWVLLCYEKPGDFCHRNIVAKWFQDNGYECKEL